MRGRTHLECGGHAAAVVRAGRAAAWPPHSRFFSSSHVIGNVERDVELIPSAPFMPNVYTFKDFEGSSHRILIGLIRRFSTPGGTLLDLGAAGGELGSAVRDQFQRTIGFEYEATRIPQLRQH